jgi:uncharacterized protein YegP (UPF0339 family)
VRAGSPPGAEISVRVNPKKECAVVGKFEVYKDRTDKFRFRLKAGNGEVIAVSEAYNSKSSALGGVESVRKNAPDAKLDDQTS